MKLAIRLESLGQPFRAALATAARIGVTGVQMDAVGDFRPDQLSDTGRREVAFLLRSHGLELTALGCPMRRGLDDPANLDARIAYVQQSLSLSFELGARRVIVDAGVIPEKDDNPQRQLLRHSLMALGAFADRVGSSLAMATGADSPDRLATFLGSMTNAGLGVNFDAGNFLAHGYDPVAAVSTLKGKIIHVYAQDARRGGSGRMVQSVPLGGGDVDWMALSGTLSVNDYRGWIVVKTDDPDMASVEAGVTFLRRLI